jgi:hypothetical protein
VIDNILGRRHVELNGLFLPANAAVLRARQACVPLHATTGDPDWPVSNMGSGILYARNGRKISVFTRHQLGKHTHPSQIMVRMGPDTSACLNGGARFVQFPFLEFGPEEFDVCAVEMPWRVPTGPSVPLFMNALQTTPLPDDRSERFFAVGYPSRLTRIDGEMRSEHIGLTQVLVWAKGLVLKRGDLPMLDLMPGTVMVPRCGGDFDGFSGGPVFGITTQLLTLRGIIIRGGIDKLFFAPTEWIDRVCDKALAEPVLNEIAA